jgi:hypothetical protein
VGVIGRAEGEHANAAARFDTSIRLFESTGQRREIAVGGRERGILLLAQGRRAAARRHLEQSLATFRGLGDLFNAANTH